MSTKYKIGDDVPTEVLAKRLAELSDAVTKGPPIVVREFVMRVPAEVDHDADLVLSSSAKRLEKIQKDRQTIRDLTNTQLQNGNWNYDPYMHGMANGMILCLSILDGEEQPNYKDAPEVWIKDIPTDTIPEGSRGPDESGSD